MSVTLLPLKKYGMRVSAIVSALALPLLFTASSAYAAPLHTQATPAFSCESGYDEVWDGNHLYLTANGTNGTPATVETNPSSCWKGPGGSFSQFKDQAGDCLAWDQTTLTVNVQVCAGASATWQYWEAGSINGVGSYLNEYAANKNEPNVILAASGSASGDYVALANGEAGKLENWYAGS
jgi:hypothetical protein